MNLKEVELITVEGANYLASNETNNDLFIFSINNKLTVAYFDELLGDDIMWVKNVAATPEQIGLIYEGIVNSEYHKIVPITQEHIDQIKEKSGKCFIEVMNIYDKLPDDVDVKTKTFEPILVDNKVIIHLNG
jgi:hypothetical protein